MATKGDVKGFDLDGDGYADIGLDGKPTKYANPDWWVTKDGVTGLDLNKDGKPDIGPNGEILKDAPIVQGPDGTIGVDVDGNGHPDIGISGQVLPDAHIVTADGVRGLDVKHDGVYDGIPDIGMDGKPLAHVPHTSYHGVTGLDVDGDGKPDITLDGKPTDWAPIATRPDGIQGIDINNDHKPDIALPGGQKVDTRDVVAIAAPHLPAPADFSPITASPSHPLVTDGAPTNLASIGLGAPGSRPDGTGAPWARATDDAPTQWASGTTLGGLKTPPDSQPPMSQWTTDGNDPHTVLTGLGSPTHTVLNSAGGMPLGPSVSATTSAFTSGAEPSSAVGAVQLTPFTAGAGEAAGSVVGTSGGAAKDKDKKTKKPNSPAFEEENVWNIGGDAGTVLGRPSGDPQ
jgi:hypothetical protein